MVMNTQHNKTVTSLRLVSAGVSRTKSV